jgi:hypothetical protein
MCATGSERPQAFFLAGDASLSQEVAGGKISVQSTCALNTDIIKLNLQYFTVDTQGYNTQQRYCVVVIHYKIQRYFRWQKILPDPLY